jgi:hypothetical protein
MSATRGPCPDCPYRESSSLCYDPDSIIALLDTAQEPRCHKALGVMWGIFEEHPTPENRCLGYDTWNAGEEGFTLPRTAGLP